MKRNDKLYVGFRKFVTQKDLDIYDSEYFSKKTNSKKSMISLIDKYVNVYEVYKKKLLPQNKELFKFYFSYSYDISNQKKIKESRITEDILPTYQIKFLFK